MWLCAVPPGAARSSCNSVRVTPRQQRNNIEPLPHHLRLRLGHHRSQQHQRFECKNESILQQYALTSLVAHRGLRDESTTYRDQQPAATKWHCNNHNSISEWSACRMTSKERLLRYMTFIALILAQWHVRFSFPRTWTTRSSTTSTSPVGGTRTTTARKDKEEYIDWHQGLAQPNLSGRKMATTSRTRCARYTSCASTSRWLSRTSTAQLRRMVPRMGWTSSIESSTSVKDIEVHKMNIDITGYKVIVCKKKNKKEEQEVEHQIHQSVQERRQGVDIQHQIHQSTREWHQGLHHQDSRVHLHQRDAQAVAPAESICTLEIGINTEPETQHPRHQKGIHQKEAYHQRAQTVRMLSQEKGVHCHHKDPQDGRLRARTSAIT